jgi:hypothetical protein
VNAKRFRTDTAFALLQTAGFGTSGRSMGARNSLRVGGELQMSKAILVLASVLLAIYEVIHRAGRLVP